jgi:hypothetical protein
MRRSPHETPPSTPRHSIQIASHALLVSGRHISAQHPEVCLLDDVVDVRRVVEDAIHISTEPGRSTGIEGRERRLIETAHA